MNQQQLQEVYKMVDSVSFSRAKKNIGRDFSDGVMMAEVVHHYNPKIIQLHNYPPANSLNKKIDNWNTLNHKVLKKIGVPLTRQQIDDIANASPGIVQEVLYQVFLKFQQPEEEGSLSKNAKMFESRGLRRDNWNEEENESKENKVERSAQKRRGATGEGNAETDEILDLVAKIDVATEKLLQLRQQSKLKDEIIHNLQSKIEKLIFN